MRKVSLKDISKLITSGLTPLRSNPEFWEQGEIPWLKTEQIGDRYIYETTEHISRKALEQTSLKMIPSNSVSVAMYGEGKTRGSVSVIRRPMTTNQACCNIILDENVADYNYIYYYLKTQYTNLRALSSGVRKNLNSEDLKTFKVSLPELTIQQQIASVLSALDDKIELNNKINAELEAMAKTLYDYWFVQFDFPNAEGKPYKSSGGEMVYDEVLKRESPKGWEVKRFSDFISNDKSGDWGKEVPEGNYITKVECIRGADINGINGKGEVKAPTRYILEKNQHKILQARDLIVEISGGSPTQSTGRLAYITREVIERFENPLICSNFCKAVSLKKENQFFYFIYSWNKAYDNGAFFGFEGKTSGIKNLLFESLVDNYKVATPADDLLEKFEKAVSIYEKKRQLNLKQNQELASLRDWLLPMLMNGQVKVAEAYEEVEEKLRMVAEEETGYRRASRT